MSTGMDQLKTSLKKTFAPLALDIKRTSVYPQHSPVTNILNSRRYFCRQITTLIALINNHES
jgi:hypothetical protein